MCVCVCVCVCVCFQWRYNSYQNLLKVSLHKTLLIIHPVLYTEGAGRSSEVERSLMVRWVVGSILHGVDPLSYFSFQPVLHDW